MRIGFYHDGVGQRHGGGVGVYIRHLAVELSSGHVVTLFTGTGSETSDLVDAGVHVVEIGSAASNSGPLPWATPSVSHLAKAACSGSRDVLDHLDRDVDLLVTFQDLDDLLVSHLVDVPTVRVFHSEFTPWPLSALRARVGRTDHHLATSPQVAYQITDQLGYEVDGIVSPGVDVDVFSPAAEPAFESQEPTVCFVGRVVESNGIFDLIDAISLLDEDVNLRIVGDGALDIARRRADRRSVADDVQFAGPVAHSAVPGYLGAADVCCHPSRAPRFGLVNLEAMACATPVIATGLADVLTYLQPGEHGLVVPRRSPESIANALSVLLDDAERRTTMGRRGRRRAHEFTWYEQAKRFASVCECIQTEDESRSQMSFAH